jgi:hypothetical protein
MDSRIENCVLRNTHTHTHTHTHIVKYESQPYISYESFVP